VTSLSERLSNTRCVEILGGLERVVFGEAQNERAAATVGERAQRVRYGLRQPPMAALTSRSSGSKPVRRSLWIIVSSIIASIALNPHHRTLLDSIRLI
jgi:hypothetical protein